MEARPSEKRALLGTVLISASNVFKLLLQFAVLPILAHLLSPAAYGLVALAMPFILLANIFSDGGLGSIIIRSPATSKELESTVFWTSTAISAGLAAGLCLLAWPISLIVRQPGVVPILVTLSSILIISGMSAAANAKILREQRYHAFAGSDVCSAVVAAAVAFWSAAHGCGAWSLVWQQITLWSIRLVWLSLASKVRVRFIFQPKLLTGGWSFGANTIGVGVLDFASRNVDNLLVGAILGLGALGHYTMAYQLMRMPELVVAGPVYVALYPLLARLVNDRERFNRLALSSLMLVCAAVLPTFAGMAAVADLAVGTILGDQWRESARVLSLLAPAGAAFSLYAIFAGILFARGRPYLQFQISFLIATGTVIGVMGGCLGGVRGVAIGVSTVMVAAAPLYIVSLARELEVPVGRVLACFWSAALATAAMVAAVAACRLVLQSYGLSFQFAGAVLTGVTVYAAALWTLSGKRIVEEVRTILAARPSAIEAQA